MRGRQVRLLAWSRLRYPRKYGCQHAVKIGFNFSAPAGQKRFNLTED
jgi:hypothetical protein